MLTGLLLLIPDQKAKMRTGSGASLWANRGYSLEYRRQDTPVTYI
jgi:hypothetical protein